MSASKLSKVAEAAERASAPKSRRRGKFASHRARPKAPTRGALSAGRDVALAVAEAGQNKKANRVQIMDVTGKVDYADYVVVMSGRSGRQVQAIARGVEEELKQQGVRCLSSEGHNQATWVLIDFTDVIVHVFHEDVRDYYDLEALWMDAERVPVKALGGV